MKKRIHICTGCGKREKCDPSRRQWCKCNPSAPFKMMVESDYRLAHAVAGASLRALAAMRRKAE